MNANKLLLCPANDLDIIAAACAAGEPRAGGAGLPAAAVRAGDALPRAGLAVGEGAHIGSMRNTSQWSRMWGEGSENAKHRREDLEIHSTDEKGCVQKRQRRT